MLFETLLEGKAHNDDKTIFYLENIRQLINSISHNYKQVKKAKKRQIDRQIDRQTDR